MPVSSYRKSGTKFTGVDLVLKKLNKKILEIENGTRAGMRTSVLLVKRDSLKETPVDTGHLRGSAFTEVDKAASGYGWSGMIGYIANYAHFVHEIPKRYRVGGVGYLRKSLFKNSRKILRILQLAAKIK